MSAGDGMDYTIADTFQQCAETMHCTDPIAPGDQIVFRNGEWYHRGCVG